MIALEDFRIINVILSLLCLGALAYRLRTAWTITRWFRRVDRLSQILVLVVIAYGSWQTWDLNFPPADYVWMVTLALALRAGVLLTPRRRHPR